MASFDGRNLVKFPLISITDPLCMQVKAGSRPVAGSGDELEKSLQMAFDFSLGQSPN
jgi:hypothetical protein